MILMGGRIREEPGDLCFGSQQVFHFLKASDLLSNNPGSLPVTWPASPFKGFFWHHPLLLLPGESHYFHGHRPQATSKTMTSPASNTKLLRGKRFSGLSFCVTPQHQESWFSLLATWGRLCWIPVPAHACTKGPGVVRWWLNKAHYHASSCLPPKVASWYAHWRDETRAARDLPSVSLSSTPPHHLCKPQSTTEPCASCKNSLPQLCSSPGNSALPNAQYVPNKGHCMAGGQGHWGSFRGQRWSAEHASKAYLVGCRERVSSEV